MFDCEKKGLAPGLVLRMAPISGNTVVYTKDANAIPGFKPVDQCVASGFRVVGEKQE